MRFFCDAILEVAAIMQHYDIQRIYTLMTTLNRQITNIEQIPDLELKDMRLLTNFQLQLTLDYFFIVFF